LFTLADSAYFLFKRNCNQVIVCHHETLAVLYCTYLHKQWFTLLCIS